MKTVSFTGHRPDKIFFSEKDSKYIRLKALLFKIVNRLYEYGYRDFISGMAIGFDTWAAEAVCELKKQKSDVGLICAVPFESQDSLWTKEAKNRRKKLMDEAKEVVIVSDKYSRGCFHKRNRYMVDNSEVIVCFYDGTQTGGTAYTVNYGLEKGKVVIRIDPTTFKVEIISPNEVDKI